MNILKNHLFCVIIPAYKLPRNSNKKVFFMKIVMIGVGTIGRTILRELVEEGHAVTIIDEDHARVDTLVNLYDVTGVVGNGACMDIQKEAGMENADLSMALTDSDELNVFACLVAKKIGVKNTIARVRNPEYRQQILTMREELGISMIVNPEKETAMEIYYMINLPSIAKMEHFAKGRVLLVEIVAQGGCLMIGQTLKSLGKNLKTKALICAVQRGNGVFIPTGNFLIEEGDRIYVTASAGTLRTFLEEVGLFNSPLKKIMIVGGNKIGFYLAEELSKRKSGHQVKLIEQNKANADELAVLLPRVDLIVGNGTQHSLLLEEGLEATDAFVSLTDIDEENMISSMFANKLNVRKSITLIRSDDIGGMLRELGIQNTVSPKNITANRVLSYVRALANKRGSNILTLSKVVEGHVEALEFYAKTEEDFYNVPLKDLELKPSCLIACIIRNHDVIIPNGESVIKQGDNVIVVTTQRNFDDLTDILA